VTPVIQAIPVPVLSTILHVVYEQGFVIESVKN